MWWLSTNDTHTSKMLRHIRELATFLYLALEVPLLVQEVLKPKVRLVHLMARIRGGLLVSSRGMIGGPVEGLESSEEGACADLDEGGVVVEEGGGDKVAQGVELGVWSWRQEQIVVVCGSEGGHVRGD